MKALEITFKIIHVIMFSAGISFNGFLIYLSLFKSPKIIRTYSVLILNHAITDFIACAFDFFTQPRLMATGWTVAFAANGPCQLVSSWSCVLGWSVQLHCFIHSLYLLLICFAYRYLIIVRSPPSVKVLQMITFIAYIPSFLQAIFFSIDSSDPQVIEQIVKESRPDDSLDGFTFNGYISLFSPMTAYAASNVSLSPVLIYTGILYFRSRIVHFLNISADHMTDQTKEMHTQLLKALTIQALLPLLNLISIFIYFIGQFDIYHNPFLEYLDLVIVQIVPVITPVVSFVYIRPYRTVIVRFLSRVITRQKTIGPSQKTSSWKEVSRNIPEN